VAGLWDYYDGLTEEQFVQLLHPEPQAQAQTQGIHYFFLSISSNIFPVNFFLVIFGFISQL